MITQQIIIDPRLYSYDSVSRQQCHLDRISGYLLRQWKSNYRTVIKSLCGIVLRLIFLVGIANVSKLKLVWCVLYGTAFSIVCEQVLFVVSTGGGVIVLLVTHALPAYC